MNGIPTGWRNQRMPAASGAGPRRAFTLLELLVVLGILLLVAALGVGAFMRVGTVNRLVATEHLIADLVRQARMTARTSGSPVTLTITKAPPAIAGVSRTILWSCGFEGTDFPVGADLDFRARAGRTGTGLLISANAVSGPTPRFPAPVPTLNAAHPNDARRNHLTRKKAGPSEGFILQVAVCPPRLQTAPQKFLPLVMVANNAGSAPASADGSACGLRLVLTTRPMTPGAGGFPTRIRDNASTAAPTSGPVITTDADFRDPRFWAVEGWIHPEGGAPLFIDSENDAVPNTQSAVDGGGTWEELALLYDGTNLALLRDGRLIASKATTGVRLAGYGLPQTIALGAASYDGPWIDPGDVAGEYHLPLEAILDDALLARLGIELPHALPTGMVPKDDYRLTVLPNGSVWSNSTAGGLGTVTLQFTGTAEESELTATIDIQPGTGAVKATAVKVKP